MHPARVQSGFSLIEVLVVLTIVAILAALLLPAIATARRLARTTRCAAHLRQVGMAVMAYADDQLGIMPPAKAPRDWAPTLPDNPADPAVLHWHELILPWLDRTRSVAGGGVTWGCPAWKGRSGNVGWTGYGLITRPDLPRSWTVTNIASWDGFLLHVAYRPLRAEALTEPSQRILISDANDWWISHQLWRNAQGWYGQEDLVRHQGASNGLFVDGHVETIPIAKAWAAFQNPAYYR